jgi:V-type H+-transporting ATPase subunit a
MMFGDMGHGSIYLFIGSVLVLFNNQLKGGALNFLLEYRYLLFMMGFMSVYCGFIYNEWFAIPTQVFSSCYMNPDGDGIMQSSRFQWNATEDDTG